MAIYPKEDWNVLALVQCWVIVLGGVMGALLPAPTLFAHIIGFVIGVPVTFVVTEFVRWFFLLGMVTVLKIYKNKKLDNGL